VTAPELIEALRPVVSVLDQLAVAYHLGGSVASSVFGMSRSTLDANLVADLKLDQVDSFVALLGEAYYASPEMIRDAILRRSSFNVVHNELAYKIDIFIPTAREFDQIAFTRARQEALIDEPGARLFNVASPEDIVLRKLEWFAMGGRVSERQWLDTIGVLKVQAKSLDYDYLWEWAQELNLSELLQKALTDAGL
jgi:hypothetical protein